MLRRKANSRAHLADQQDRLERGAKMAEMRISNFNNTHDQAAADLNPPEIVAEVFEDELSGESQSDLDDPDQEPPWEEQDVAEAEERAKARRLANGEESARYCETETLASCGGLGLSLYFEFLKHMQMIFSRSKFTNKTTYIHTMDKLHTFH